MAHCKLAQCVMDLLPVILDDETVHPDSKLAIVIANDLELVHSMIISSIRVNPARWVSITSDVTRRQRIERMASSILACLQVIRAPR